MCVVPLHSTLLVRGISVCYMSSYLCHYTSQSPVDQDKYVNNSQSAWRYHGGGSHRWMALLGAAPVESFLECMVVDPSAIPCTSCYLMWVGIAHIIATCESNSNSCALAQQRSCVVVIPLLTILVFVLLYTSVQYICYTAHLWFSTQYLCSTCNMYHSHTYTLMLATIFVCIIPYQHYKLKLCYLFW